LPVAKIRWRKAFDENEITVSGQERKQGKTQRATQKKKKKKRKKKRGSRSRKKEKNIPWRIEGGMEINSSEEEREEEEKEK